MEKTALNLVIDALKSVKQQEPITSYAAVIYLLQSLLPTEQQQITEAYTDGMRDERYDTPDKLNYFKTKYK